MDMEWTSSDHQQDNNTNGTSKLEADGKLIKPPDNPGNGAEAIPTGPAIDSEEYPMNGKHRGKALIFSHFFENKPKDIRLGNKVDEDRIKTQLEHLSFDVKIYRDKKVKEIKTILKETSKENHSDNDCLLVVVMSHGAKTKRLFHGAVYEIQAKDGFYDENNLFDYFNSKYCPSLHGKPKIFLIQACRGKDEQKVSLLSHRTQTDGVAIPQNSYYYQPDDSDFFIFRAALDGTVSFRDEATGTPFIQAICDVLSDNRRRKYSRDFMTMMTSVIQKVATENAQQPNISSTFLRLLYLKPKNYIER